MKNTIKLTESELNKVIKESVNKILKEIGDTEKGQFALGAVRGRATARPQYHNDKYGSLSQRSKCLQTQSDAMDKSWENIKDVQDNIKSHQMNSSEKMGYLYGFTKGVNESFNKVSKESYIEDFISIDPWDLDPTNWDINDDDDGEGEIYQFFDKNKIKIYVDIYIDYGYAPHGDGDSYRYYTISKWKLDDETQRILQQNLSQEAYNRVLQSVEDYVDFYNEKIEERGYDMYYDEGDRYDEIHDR